MSYLQAEEADHDELEGEHCKEDLARHRAPHLSTGAGHGTLSALSTMPALRQGTSLSMQHQLAWMTAPPTPMHLRAMSYPSALAVQHYA